MKMLLFFSLATFCLFSCKTGIKTDEAEAMVESGEAGYEEFKLDTLKGMYVGDFGGSDIWIVINYVSHNHAVGYNVHKGLQRNISGTLNEDAKEIKLELHEPGDHKFDGTFYITFNKSDLSVSGYWQSNSSKISKKKFKLEKIKNQYEDGEGFDMGQLTVDKINRTNFPEVFHYTSDTIGDLFFSEDGLCRYEYYPSLDSAERREQINEIAGSWSLSPGKVTVSWKKNTYFPAPKSTFKIVIDTVNYEYYLEYKNRKFYNHFYGY